MLCRRHSGDCWSVEIVFKVRMEPHGLPSSICVPGGLSEKARTYFTLSTFSLLLTDSLTLSTFSLLVTGSLVHFAGWEAMCHSASRMRSCCNWVWSRRERIVLYTAASSANSLANEGRFSGIRSKYRALRYAVGDS